MTKASNEGEIWLRICFENWTKSPVCPEAWQYRGDFDGFCKWFLGDRKAKVVITDYLTKGGIPDGWTPENLDWLAKAHAHHAEARWQSHASKDRVQWHRRWAALLADVLETRRGQG